MPTTDRPPVPTAAQHRAQLARVDADLAAARLRRERLDYSSAVAQYTAGCRGRRSPEDLAVSLADVDATIAELEASREALAGAAALAPATATAPAPSSPEPEPEYLGTRDAAALLGISARTLEGLRARGAGPPHIRIGKRVLYPIASLRTPAK